MRVEFVRKKIKNPFCHSGLKYFMQLLIKCMSVYYTTYQFRVCNIIRDLFPKIYDLNQARVCHHVTRTATKPNLRQSVLSVTITEDCAFKYDI